MAFSEEVDIRPCPVRISNVCDAVGGQTRVFGGGEKSIELRSASIILGFVGAYS